MPFNKLAALEVKRTYLCWECYGFLWSMDVSEIRPYNANLQDGQIPIEIPNKEDPTYRVVVFCPTHGDVEVVGRVTRFWAIMEGQKRASRARDLRFKMRKEERERLGIKFDPDQTLAELGY